MVQGGDRSQEHGVRIQEPGRKQVSHEAAVSIRYATHLLEAGYNIRIYVIWETL